MKTKILFILITSSIFILKAQDKILLSLQNSPINNIIPMQDKLKSQSYKSEFNGKVFFVTLNDGTKAVFKDLTNDIEDAYAEVAAFKASQFLGFPNIPPTVIREISSKIGTLQLYIEPSIDALIHENYLKAFEMSPKEDVANLKLFYFIFGQWDTGPHNIIIKEEDKRIKLYAIDNSGIVNEQYVRYGELPCVKICYSEKLNTQDFDKSFPFNKIETIKNPTIENLSNRLGSSFPKEFLKNLSKNTWPISFVIYKNGFWRQFHKNDPDFILSHTDYYPEDSIKKLKSLNMETLKNIFSHAKGSKLLEENFLNQILERRNQVIEAYKKSKDKFIL